MTGRRIPMWIFGVALAALVAGVVSLAGTPYESAGTLLAAALVAILLVARVLGGPGMFRRGRERAVQPVRIRTRDDDPRRPR